MARSIFTLRFGAMLATAALVTGCTLKKQETPSLTGPSELGTSITVSVSPDVLTQDGVSQSVVSIVARDSNGQPLRNVSMRADISVNGVTTDFGTLSARNLVTDAGGHASTIFTAPVPVVIQNPDGSSTVAAPPDVQIMIRPVESDFGNSTPRTATIHLIPKGTVVPPNSTVKADFTFNPTAPSDHQDVVFDGSPSSSVGGAIVDWQWTFSDGARKSGMVVTHDFETAGTFSVTLRVTDTIGASNTISKSITVGQGATPTASFVMSPASPVLNQQVNFNASASTATAGRVIQSFDWDFGDGTAHQSGVTTSHAFSTAGTFTVVLVVTDDAGHIGTTTQSVTVSNGNPTAQITVSPPSSTVGQAISFIGSQSVAAPGRTIISYSWNFGDGNTGSGATTSHAYAATGSYTVTLVVKDDQGKEGIATATVTIQ